MGIIKRKYQLIQTNKKFPCKNCLIFPICKAKYSDMLSLIKFEYKRYAIDNYSIDITALKRIILNCDLAKEWFNRHPINDFYTLSQHKKC